MTIPERVHVIADLIGPDRQYVQTGAGGAWVRPVPFPKSGSRLAAAWWVLTGRAEAVVWPRPQDLEQALDADK